VDNLPLLEGIQPGEIRCKAAALSLARRVMESGHLLHSALTCHRVQMHGDSNRDTHLSSPHNNSSVYLRTIAEVPRSGQITDGMRKVGEHYETP